MTASPASKVIRRLRTAVLREAAGLSDGQLLECYLREREEAAFASLVRRHGPMVWGVCRRVLGNHHDAEDAFQATFLVLVRKAATVLPRQKVANWLYGVAHLTALKARAAAAQRRVKERQVRDVPDRQATEQDLWSDLQPLLDQELSRLPEKYRTPVVLCDLEGKTYHAAARQIGCPEGTLSARLARARALLAKRLARHGLAVSGGAVALALAQNTASAGVPPLVASSTIKAATLLAAGKTAASAVIPANVAALTEGVLKAMLVTKLKTAAGLCLAIGLVLILGSGWGYSTFAADKAPAEKERDKLRDTLLVLDQQFWEAGGKHDVDTLDKLVAHDFVSVAADGTKFNKEATLQNYRVMRTADLKRTTEREVIRVNDQAAILTYQATFKVFAKNRQLIATLHQCMTSCWVQRDGGWFVAFSRVTDLPMPPVAAKPQLPSLEEYIRFIDIKELPPESLVPLTEIDARYQEFPLTIHDAAVLADTVPARIEKALKAHGGDDKLSALTTFTEKAIVRTEGVSTVEQFVQLPGKYRVETKTGAAGKTQTHTFIINGGQRRHLLNGTLVDLSGLEPPAEYWEDYLKYYGPRAVLRLKDPTNHLHFLGESKLGDRPVVGIQMVPKAGAERKFYLDKETGLLLKEVCAAQELEIVYKDYKMIGGIAVAQKRTAKIGGHESETEVVDFKAVEKLDAKLFEKP
jgi:RNA polymerase sigma factor (sigma-70 family)